MNCLIIIIIIIIIILIYFNNNIIIDCFNNININNDIEIVVARYNENIDWFFYPEFKNFKITCYNKGNNIDIKLSNNIKIINLPNVGKCDHTYLYHIINNYSSLSNVTIFIPGSWLDSHKINYSTRLINLVLDTKNTVFLGPHTNSLYKNLYYFTLDEWETSNNNNKIFNNEKKLLLSPIRPFGKWYESLFNTNIDITVITYLSMFAVHKKHILQHSISYYSNIINFVNTHSNPEVGHYIERSWAAIFYPYSNNCIYH